MKVILLLRRDAKSLTEHERLVLHGAFPDDDIRFIRADPTNYREHYEICTAVGAAAVLLPAENPIPSLAMERGIPHITVVDNKCLELLPLKPEFKEFHPK